MQTPPLLPTLNATATAIAPPARAQDVASGEQQFTQMLSRQMAERDAARSAARAVEGPKPVAHRVDSTQAPNNTTINSTAETAPAASTAGNSVEGASLTQTSAANANSDAKMDGKAAAKADPKSGTKEKTVGDASITGQSATAALDASAAIMALVANSGVAAAVTKSGVDASTVSPGASDLSRILTTDRRATEQVDLTAGSASGPSDTVVKELAAKGAAVFGLALQNAADMKSENTTANESIGTNFLTQASTDIAGLREATAALAPMQPATILQTAPTGLHPGDILAPHIASPNWDQSLGQRMVWMVAGAEQSASLTLNPPDLGPMQVVLHVSNGQADASFFSAQPEVRQALEAAMPKLREMLGEAGVTLGQTNVSAGNPQSQSAFEQMGSGPRRSAGTGGGNDSDSVASAQGGQRRLSTGNGLVDTFA